MNWFRTEIYTCLVSWPGFRDTWPIQIPDNVVS